MHILIAGDLSLQARTAKSSWSNDELKATCGCIKQLTHGCDHSIVNLESPITSQKKHIIKDGPSLKNPLSVLDFIRSCGFDIVTLANNHLKDYGCKGVLETIDKCKENAIQIVGAGCNLSEARKPLIIKTQQESVGIVNVCEHESAIALQNKAGAAPFDIANIYNDIKEIRDKVEVVLVIIHGGCEHYQLPTPRMKKEYRLIADFGADVIVNHHQHCYSGYEIYNGKPIFYGLGNFFFDNPHKRNDKWNEGIILKLDIAKDNTHFELYPYSQCDEDPVIKIKVFDEVEDRIKELNAIIADDKLLNEHFEKLVASSKPLYPFLPYGNHYLRALYNRGYLPDCMSESRKAKIENAVSCETHREVLLKFFESKLKKF